MLIPEKPHFMLFMNRKLMSIAYIEDLKISHCLFYYSAIIEGIGRKVPLETLCPIQVFTIGSYTGGLSRAMTYDTYVIEDRGFKHSYSMPYHPLDPNG